MDISEKLEKLCCVPGCKRPRSPRTPLHGFPNPNSDADRFKTWIYAVGGNMYALDYQYIYKYRNICRKHFEGKYHLGNKRLSNIAVPTLNMPGLVAKRRPMKDITKNTVNIHADKNIMEEPSTSKDVYASQRATTASPRISCRDGAVKDKQTYKKENRALVHKIAKLKKSNLKYAQRLQKAMKLSENTTFLKKMQQFTNLAAIFTMMQFREIKKTKMARRFTQEEKIMALSLFKQSPKAYRWLSKAFVLPSPMTLSRLIARASLRPGINENIFEQLKKVANKMKTDDKLCILLFDEIALSPHFDYVMRKDMISGFVNNGDTNIREIADHALVFMIRGICKNYKQPISYSFCSGSTKREELTKQIKNNISKLQSIGFQVLATVCDQGASNVSAINHLINENRVEHTKENKEFRHEIFKINNEEVIPLFDPPHLIKGIRNNLITKNLTCKIEGQKKTAKWEHLRLLLQENPAYKGIRLMKNFTDAHVNPEKINKQKVKFATQIFSETVASNMGYLADKKVLPEECKETADILIFFDHLFDSVNGSYENSKKRGGKELLRQVTPKSNHDQVWADAKKILNTMKFITPTGKECTPPSITNWVKSLNNLQYLKNKLFHDFELKSIWLRHFNQDPLENFFGCIRSHGAQNTKPSCAAFEGAFAALLINNINSRYSPGSNCEEDDCTSFKQISKIIEKKEHKDEGQKTEINYSHISLNVIEDINVKKNNPRIIGALQYVTGYVLRQAARKVFRNCQICKEQLYTKNDLDYIKIREYTRSRWLTYPSNELIKCFSEIQDVSMNILKNSTNLNNIKEYIKVALFIVVNCDLGCEAHKKKLVDFIFDLSVKFFIYNWCKDTNKLLNGTRSDHDNEDDIQRKCILYHMKRKKK